MLMMMLSVLFSMVSTAMMAYLAMNTQLGPWVAPVFVVVCMVFVIPLVKGGWFYEHAVIAIASGSVGGMIGICLGLSFPSFYFLHKELFDSWLQDPIKFSGIIFCFVVIAALYALFLGYFLRHYFLHRPRAKFPMSQLVYDVIFVDVAKKSHRLMMSGLGVATLWNSIMMLSRSAWVLYAPQLHMFPLLMSVGFVAGMTITFPVFIGLIIREFGFKLVRVHTGSTLLTNSFLMTFCFGMLLMVVLRMIIVSWKNRKSQEVQQRTEYWHKKFKDSAVFKWYVLIIGLIVAWLHFFGASVITCVYALIAIAWLSKYMVQIIAEVGIIEVDSYAWLVILPLVYIIAPPSMVVVSIAVFATLCLGLVVDFMFSYKLADLANVSYHKVVRYQMMASVCAAISAGLFFWWYCQFLTYESFALVAPKAHELDHVIKFGQYDHTVLMAGVLCAGLVLLLTSELLIVIGAVLMDPFMSLVLVIAGICAHFVKEREKLYPLWFGIYAGHMLWLIVQAIL
ncbi:hypothetical protein KAZ82_01310 [Candidatus Babeliales bacterium]|nr:hypothetical protein [Candidatus Babeliales bacterium]